LLTRHRLIANVTYMTANQFRATFYGPANKGNREQQMKNLGITRPMGLPLKQAGWTGFVNALGDHYGLDVRNFSCEAVFIEALAAKL